MTTVIIEDLIVSIFRDLEKALPLCREAMDKNGLCPAFQTGIFELHQLRGMLERSDMDYPEPIRKYLIKLRDALSTDHSKCKSVWKAAKYIYILIYEIRPYVVGMESNTTVIQYA